MMMVDSLKGQLLLDGGNLFGSYFHRTVVLVCEHNQEGAFGLVLNRSLGTQVGEMIEADIPISLYDNLLYQGGPVQPGALSYLHLGPDEAGSEIFPGLSLAHSLENLIELGKKTESSAETKIFAGYSGWAAGQLEDEMKRKAWLTYPGSMELVFFPADQDLWKHILLLKGGIYRLLADSPEDFSLN